MTSTTTPAEAAHDGRVLVLVPARGGSKGIPRKNLKLLEGKPLIVWSIEQVLATRGLTPYVSTEDEEIADVARGAGAQVIERPAELAGGAGQNLSVAR